jgi:hypothetical protein
VRRGKKGPRITKIGRHSFISSNALDAWLTEMEKRSSGHK